MAKMWAGFTDGLTDNLADDFNSSISFDCRMFREDINGSIAHAKMLAKQKIISDNDAEILVEGLSLIKNDLDEGKLKIDPKCEDIHMFIEEVLTERVGDVGRKLHTARSRNDQVALDLRMYLRESAKNLSETLRDFVLIIADKAEEYKNVIVPGYTHLQRAQPIMFGHHLLAYAMMFLRDIDRISDAVRRMNVSPIGSCALAGTTYNTDRQFEASLLDFDSVCQNSIDGVSDRDFCVELLSDFSILMMHMSRMSEEIILWSSWEFKYVEISDKYTTGSSIMPQKKNSDMNELIRGKTGRVYGDLIGTLTMLKGLPLAYNKDMQEDKESIFDALDTVVNCVNVLMAVVKTMKAHPENMKAAAQTGFINATDLADYLVGKGLPFRTAYKISGTIVSDCSKNGFILENYPIEKYKEASALIDEDVYDAVNIENCVNRRTSEGGTSVQSIEKQIELIRGSLKK